MGLLYSMMYYFKSWYSVQPQLHLSESKIIVSVNKLVHQLRHRQLQVQKEAQSLEASLMVAISQPKNTRSLPGEQELMEAIVRKGELIIRCANTIKKEARILETDSFKASQECMLAICTIIYAYKDLELADVINLNDFVPQPHPAIEKKHISEPLREYVEFEGATFFAINTYILEMCHRNQLSLEKVNEIGHNFAYTPSKLQRQSKSSAMFALSVQEVELVERMETE